jgi:hypothetical protein
MSEIRKDNAAAKKLISKYHRHEKLGASNQRATIRSWAKDCHMIGDWGGRDGGAAIQMQSS